jgi:AmiR/NasT family two-component response regulator
MRILIVEDEMLVALDIQGTLESAGHTILGIALTIAEAVKVAEDDCPDEGFTM